MESSSSGELDMLPVKRKSAQRGGSSSGSGTGRQPLHDSASAIVGAGAGAAAGTAQPLAPPVAVAAAAAGCTMLGARTHQRVSFGPTCSSPATPVGGWGTRSGGGGGGPVSSTCCSGDPSEDTCCQQSCEASRGKAQRVCSSEAVAAAAAAGGSGASAPSVAAMASEAEAAVQAWPDSSSTFGCQVTPSAAINSSRLLQHCLSPHQSHHPSSLPPAMYRSYHLGCCTRLCRSSPAELEAAGAAAAGAAEAVAAGAGTGTDGAFAACCCCGSGGDGSGAGAEHAGVHAAHVCMPAGGSCNVLLAAATALPPLQQQPDAAAHQHDTQPRQQQGQGQGQGHEAVGSIWADVPDDILKRVLERLQPSTLRVLRLVCRGWEASASRLLRHLRPETVVGKHLGRRFPALHSLDLSNCIMGVDFASPRMLRLQSLLTDGHLSELAGLTRLQQLSLRGCNRLTGVGLSQLECLPSLSMLNLSNCTGITDDGLAALAAVAPQLDTLNLQGCSRLGDGGVAHLAALPALRHILLPAGVTDASMALLAEMPALERVALRGCSRVTTAGIYMLLQRRGLKRIVISKCPHITLESLCEESNLKVVTEPGAHSALAPAALSGAMFAAAAAAAAGAAAAMAGHDMQLLVAEV